MSCSSESSISSFFPVIGFVVQPATREAAPVSIHSLRYLFTRIAKKFEEIMFENS